MAKTPASEIVDAFGNVLEKSKKALGKAAKGVGESAVHSGSKFRIGANEAFALPPKSASQPITRVKTPEELGLDALTEAAGREGSGAPKLRRTPEQVNADIPVKPEPVVEAKPNASEVARQANYANTNADAEAKAADSLAAAGKAERKAPVKVRETADEIAARELKAKQAQEKGVFGTTADLAKKAKAGTWDKLSPGQKRALGLGVGIPAAIIGGVGLYQGAKSLLGDDNAGPFTPKSGGNGPAAGAGAAPAANAGAGATSGATIAKPAAESSVAKKEPVTAEEMTAAFGAPLATLTPENAGTIRGEIASGRSKFRTAVMPDGTIGVFDPNRLPLATRQKKQAEQDAADATARQAKKDAEVKAQATMSPDEKRLAELKKQTNFTAQTAAEEKELRTRIQAAHDRKQELAVPVAVAEAKAKADANELGARVDIANNEMASRERIAKAQADYVNAGNNAKARSRAIESWKKDLDDHASLMTGSVIGDKGNEILKGNLAKFGIQVEDKDSQGAQLMLLLKGASQLQAAAESKDRSFIGPEARTFAAFMANAKKVDPNFNVESADDLVAKLAGKPKSESKWYNPMTWGN